MVKQPIDQRAAVMPRGRMNHQARLFVHHNQRLILVQNTQWHRFRPQGDRCVRRDLPGNPLANADLVTRFSLKRLYPDGAFADQGCCH